MTKSLPFLRIPPFPGGRNTSLCVPVARSAGGGDPELLVARLRSARVGGTFWALQPQLPQGRDIVLAPGSPAEARALLAQAQAEGIADRAVLLGNFAGGGGVPALRQPCDPWHIAAQASELRTASTNELARVAAALGKPVLMPDSGGDAGEELRLKLGRELLQQWQFRDPFTGEPIGAFHAVEILAEWRSLIDANRDVAAVLGVARWKRVTLDALLWNGSHAPPYASTRSLRALGRGSRALAWKTRASASQLARLESDGVEIGEIEDGFIRSRGLGANCVPPLSVIVDFAGAHFDPAQPSGLENILQHDDISQELVARAAALRQTLVRGGISKYGHEESTGVGRPGGGKRHVLVTGQVEDDRAVICGGAGVTNLELVRRARALEPEAWLIYKPHPDVEAGHRKGHVPDAEILRHADQIERTAAITTLLDSVDGVHVISSLTGFEALMRGKEVTTHGVPFYAGWGLTRDLGPVPGRRSRKRSLDELVAATLILYPRYLDPVTRLPCPVEVLIGRMLAEQDLVTSPLVKVREWQGRLNLALKRLRKAAG